MLEHNCTPKHLHAVLTKKSRFASKTIRESMTTAPEVIKGTPHNPQGAQAEYRVTSNKERIDKAHQAIQGNEDEVRGRIFNREDISDQTIVDGQILAQKLQESGNFNDAINVLETLSEKLSRAGQTVQAASIWNKLTPEGALRYAEKVTRKAGKKLTPEAAEDITNQAKKVQAAKNKRAKEVESAVLMKKIADQVPASKLKQLATLHTMAQLLNPKTAIRNIVGNGLFAASEHSVTAAAAIIDKGVSAITKKRTVTFPKLKAAKTGLTRGIAEGLQEAKLGINTQGTKFDLPFGQVFKNPILQKAETALHIELSAADRAFSQMAYRESVANQLAAAGKNARITPEMIARAQYEALYKTFQDESAAAKMLSGVKKALNLKKDFGLGDFILKYPKTPGNLLSRGLDYSPVGFAKVIYEPLKPLLKKGEFNQREFSQSMARAVIGTGGVMGVGYTLGKLGLVTGQQDADKDISKAKKIAGYKPYSLNRDGLLRFAMSGMNPESAKPQPGDTWVSYDWAQPLSIVFSAGVNVAQGGKKEASQQAQDALATGLKTTIEGADTLTNQGVMQGLQKTFSGRDDEGRSSLAAGVLDVAASAPSSFVPTFIKQINDVTDNTARETYDPNKLTQSLNQVKAKIPGLSQTLPARADIYGQTDERYQDGSNNAFNVFLNPAFVSKLKSDPTGDEVIRLYQDAGETQQSPQTAPKKVTITQRGQKVKLQLSGQQLVDYQRYIGQGSKKILDSVVQMKPYQRLSDEGKASLMAALITDINTAAKIKLFGHRPTRRPSYVTMGVLKNSSPLIMAGIRKHFMGEFRSEIKKRRAAAGP